MTTGGELFVEMVRAKHRREDQTAEIARLRSEVAKLREALRNTENALYTVMGHLAGYPDHSVAAMAEAELARREARAALANKELEEAVAEDGAG